MELARKITVHIPEPLLRKAQEATGTGITSTIHQALELLAAGPAYEKLRQLKGKVKFSLRLKELRKDKQ